MAKDARSNNAGTSIRPCPACHWHKPLLLGLPLGDIGCCLGSASKRISLSRRLLASDDMAVKWLKENCAKAADMSYGYGSCRTFATKPSTTLHVSYESVRVKKVQQAAECSDGARRWLRSPLEQACKAGEQHAHCLCASCSQQSDWWRIFEMPP